MEGEKSIERMVAALELLTTIMQEQADHSCHPLFSLVELNHVLIVAGIEPVLTKEEREVDVIDTV